MNLMDALLGVILVGMLTAVFSFVPNEIAVNDDMSSAYVEMADFATELHDEIKRLNTTDTNEIDDLIRLYELNAQAEIRPDFQIEREYIDENGKPFVKVTIKKHNYTQTYYWNY